MNIKIVSVKQKILKNKENAVTATTHCFYELALQLYKQVISDHRMLYSVKHWYKTKLFEKEHIAKAVINFSLAIIKDDCNHAAVRDDQYLELLNELLHEVREIKLRKCSDLAKNNAITDKIIEMISSLINKIIADLESDNKLYFRVINKFSKISELDEPVKLTELEQTIVELGLYSGAFTAKSSIMMHLLKAEFDLRKFAELPSNVKKFKESKCYINNAKNANIKRFVMFLLNLGSLDCVVEGGYLTYEFNGFLFKVKESENRYDFENYIIEEIEHSGFDCEADTDAVSWFLDEISKN